MFMKGAPLTCLSPLLRRLVGLIALLQVIPLVNGQAVITWGGSTGSWNTGSNWVLNSAPTTVDTAQITSGNASIDSDVTIAALNFNGGTISGSSDLYLTGSGSSWTGASMSGSGSTILNSGASMTLYTTGNHDLNGRILQNNGTINWSLGYLRGGNSATLTNASGATFNDQNASGYSINNPFGGIFSFINNGTYTRNVGSVTYFDVPLYNNATVNLQQGTIQLRADGTMSATSVVNASAGTNLIFTNNYTLETGAEFKGDGTIKQTGGTLTIDGNLKAVAFEWQSGNWNSAAAATTTIDATTVLNLTTTGNKDFNQRSITNNGTVNWNLGYIRGGNGSVFTNAAGALFNDLNTSGYTINNPFGGIFSFVNQGTYHKTTVGTTVVGVPFTNDSGEIKVDAGKLQFSNTFTQIAGSLAVANNATLQFDSGLNLSAGKLGGSGTIIGNVTTSGEISPGNSAGTFNITGDLTFGSTSGLKVELGGTTQGTEYDFLDITGAATLNGTLSLSFISNFEISAQSTDTFIIVDSSALSGQFSNVSNGSRITTTDGLGSFIVNYSSIAVSLSDFQAVPEPSTWALMSLGGLLLIYHQIRLRPQRK